MTREEAIKNLVAYAYYVDNPMPEEVAKSFDMAIDALQTEVVRCKDCKWSYRYEISSGEYRCYCMEHGSSGHTDDDFCSYGEKVKP